MIAKHIAASNQRHKKCVLSSSCPSMKPISSWHWHGFVVIARRIKTCYPSEKGEVRTETTTYLTISLQNEARQIRDSFSIQNPTGKIAARCLSRSLPPSSGSGRKRRCRAAQHNHRRLPYSHLGSSDGSGARPAPRPATRLAYNVSDQTG